MHLKTSKAELSFWWQQIGAPTYRAPLPGTMRVDVCIVGAGYTGLWAAYYLKQVDPTLNVVVVEKHFAGFGASGRNGGWLENTIVGGRQKYVRTHGRVETERFQHVMNRSIDEIIRVAKAEGWNADIVKGGELKIACNPAQRDRLVRATLMDQQWSMTDVELLTAGQVRKRVNAEGVMAGVWHPHCAKVHPAKLVFELARTVELLGVPIYEKTSVQEIRPGTVLTDHGGVEADYVIRATEGFTSTLKGLKRTWLPLNSSMAVTMPLPRSVWNDIGWDDSETLGDAAHGFIYAQRTADGRIAFGGRGVPYRYGSKTHANTGTPERTRQSLRAAIDRRFPAVRDYQLEHYWSGTLGVPRDWSATVGLDRGTGLAWAGGYVGAGLTATNLAGRTLADLIVGHHSEVSTLPWVNHQVRKWEPEPLRWVAVNGLYRAYHWADKREDRRGKASWVAKFADQVSGQSR